MVLCTSTKNLHQHQLQDMCKCMCRDALSRNKIKHGDIYVEEQVNDNHFRVHIEGDGKFRGEIISNSSCCRWDAVASAIREVELRDEAKK